MSSLSSPSSLPAVAVVIAKTLWEEQANGRLLPWPCETGIPAGMRVRNDARRWLVMSSYLSLQFKCMIFHLITSIFTIYGYVTNSQRDQLPSWLDSSVGRALRAAVSQRLWVRIPFRREPRQHLRRETYPENLWLSAMVGNAFLMRKYKEVLKFARCKTQTACNVQQCKSRKKLIATLNQATLKF